MDGTFLSKLDASGKGNVGHLKRNAFGSRFFALPQNSVEIVRVELGVHVVDTVPHEKLQLVR